MPDSGDNVIGVRTVYDAVLRLEGKFDAQSARFEAELDSHKSEIGKAVDDIRTEQTYLRGKIDGSLFMVKWLGPTGVAALIVGIAKATGLL